MRPSSSICFLVVTIALLLPHRFAWAEGDNWESFLQFPAGAAGRTEALALFDQDTLYVLGGQPYRCPDPSPCADPELGAADYLPAGGTEWLRGEPFDDRLQKLGGGIDGLGRPTAFGGANGDEAFGNDRTFFYDIVEGDQTEPTLARRNFLHTNFAWAA